MNSRMNNRADRKPTNSNPDIIRHLIKKYGIVDEGGIVDLTDLEGREELSMTMAAGDDAEEN